MNDETAKGILRALERIANAMESQPKASVSTAASSDIASDYEMSGPYGDPQIRKDPKNWKGAPQAGKRYSQTSPEYLEMLAGFLAWKAGKEEEEEAADPSKKKYSAYSKTDRKRALGWAKRLRDGWVAAPPAPSVVDNSAPPDWMNDPGMSDANDDPFG